MTKFMWFTDKEVDNLKNTKEEHRKTCKGSLCVVEADGGGIGTRMLASCQVCKKEYDLTDYESW